MQDADNWLSQRKQEAEAFFFRKEIPYGMALVRITMGLLVLVVMGRRWYFVRELFSSDGAPAPIADNYGFPGLFPVLSAPLAVGLYTALLFFLFTLMIGWKSRLSAIVSFVLFTYFTQLDSLSTLTKYSAIITHTFLLLSLSRCGAVWSVDRYIQLRSEGFSAPLRLLGTGAAVDIWPQRLLQIFVGMIYFGAAITKFHTQTYFTGDQLRLWLLTNVNHWNPIGEAMALYPSMLVFFGYVAIVWEILFIFTVWRRGFRIPMLLLGITFHAMTTVTLGLIVFPLVCFSTYFAFMTSEDVAWWQARLVRWNQRFRLPATVTKLPHRVSLALARIGYRVGNKGFATGLALLIGLGVVGEYSLDVYGARGSNGKLELKPISQERVNQLLTTETSVREQDKLLSFDIGKYLVGELVADNRTRFKNTDTVFAQANVIPPHGDMYVECSLEDKDGIIIDRVTGVLTRDSFRYTFKYHFNAGLVPGQYQFVLHSNQKEIARKTIELVAE